MIPVIGVPVLNRPELLLRLVDSIDYDVEHLVVIDNGQCLAGLPYNAHVKNLHLLRMPTNLGVPTSWNLVIKSTPMVPFWMILNSDAWFARGDLESFARDARRDALTLSNGRPPWCAFTLGDEALRMVGLFDESFHPAYFEDNDYERRCKAAHVDVARSSVAPNHDNSSTLAADDKLRRLNDVTFAANRRYFDYKVQTGDFTEGRWSLTRRRDLSWD